MEWVDLLSALIITGGGFLTLSFLFLAIKIFKTNPSRYETRRIEILKRIKTLKEIRNLFSRGYK